MQPDVIEQLGSSTIQHGKHNDRIYLMKAGTQDGHALVEQLKRLAAQRGYCKIFAKVPASQAQRFIDDGFIREAEIPGFFDGIEPVLMLSLFLDEARSRSRTAARNQQVMEACRRKQATDADPPQPSGATLRRCEPQDAEIMSALYAQVFQTYPFPIDEPAYIRRTMASHVVYFGVFLDGTLAALSSAEMDLEARNAEMTDFATLPAYRGRGLATGLLKAMEAEMGRRNVATAYTIARAPSFGMNITFAKMGYTFGGRLVNNTNIGGAFEDMNVWHKRLAAAVRRAGCPGYRL